jgi:altronate hydrolase
VIKYGFPIGTAISEISPGEHVHDHNLSSDYFGDPPDSRKSL